ncbi:MAG TPA: glycosyltransferase [Thermomonas sp.]
MVDSISSAYESQFTGLDSSSCPLATFLVIAYNQEDFIRDAIVGAFSQSYEAVEVILSDDCSSDRTFEIMNEMAKEYSGRFRVVVRRNERNLGILGHLLAAAKVAKGEFLVVAAGDDISFPGRTERQVLALAKAGKGVAVISSADVIFDESGDLACAEWKPATLRNWLSKQRAWFHGATACYRTSYLAGLPFPEKRILREDMAIMAIFEWAGFRSEYIPEPLIRRRLHNRNVGMERSKKDPWENELRILGRLNHIAETWEYSADVLDGAGIDAGVIRSRVSILRRYASWPEMGLLDRLSLMVDSVLAGYLRKSSFLVLFGKRYLLEIRSIIDRFRD